MTSDSEREVDTGDADAKPATPAPKPSEGAQSPAKKPTEPTRAAAPAAAPATDDGRKRMLPVVIGGAVILLVFALIAFWPGKSTTPEGDAAKKGGAAASADGDRSTRGAAGQGGVQARDYDEPSAPDRPGKRNPAVRLPNVGMAPEAPAPKDDTPPVFASKAEEIAWYERKLVQAQEVLDARQKFAERLPKVRAKIEQAPNAEQQLQAFEQRKKIVEDNYAKAQADVAEIEKKLAQLREG
jgi:ribosomal protein L15